jgi:nucleoside-diphosphate-sugar epimerase
MIAVTGATGALGSRVAARLSAAGAGPLRLVVRDARRAPALPDAEIVEHSGGYADGPVSGVRSPAWTPSTRSPRRSPRTACSST